MNETCSVCSEFGARGGQHTRKGNCLVAPGNGVQFILIDTEPGHQTFMVYGREQLPAHLRCDFADVTWRQHGDREIVGSAKGVEIVGKISATQPKNPYLFKFDLDLDKV
jgi:hypothetical protein